MAKLSVLCVCGTGDTVKILSGNVFYGEDNPKMQAKGTNTKYRSRVINPYGAYFSERGAMMWIRLTDSKLTPEDSL